MANFFEQVNETVMAKRVPDSTRSTLCRFSLPDVNTDNRPAAKFKIKFGSRYDLNIYFF